MRHYQQARRPGRCDYNQIPKRRQQRGDPTEPRNSTTMGQGGRGKGGRATAREHQKHKPPKRGRKRERRHEPTKRQREPRQKHQQDRGNQQNKKETKAKEPARWRVTQVTNTKELKTRMEGRGDPFHSETSKKDGVTRACGNYEAGDRKPVPLRSETKGAGEKRRGERQSTSYGARYYCGKKFCRLVRFQSSYSRGRRRLE